MASGRIFDPLVALRAAPLLSATGMLVWAGSEEFYLSTLGRPEHRQLANPLVPTYFSAFFYRGLPVVVSLVTLTTGTAVANLYVHRAALHAAGSFRWWVAGAALAFGHMLFVPAVAPSCKTLVEAGPEDDNHATLEQWRAVNWIRTVTVDLGAWIAVTVAVLKTLEAR